MVTFSLFTSVFSLLSRVLRVFIDVFCQKNNVAFRNGREVLFHMD